MFVGHEFLAGALVGWAARRSGAARERALSLGVVGAVAAALPDVDVGYGVAQFVARALSGTVESWEGFWVASNAIHRELTHPLPVGAATVVVVVGAAALARRDGATRLLGAGAATVVAVVLGWFAATRAGAAGALVMAAFLAGAALLGWVAARRTDHALSALGGAAAVGLLTHPFGDLFMAAPPPLLAPLGPRLVDGRLVLASDGTGNLLAVALLELGTVWLGTAVYAHLRGRDLRAAIAPQALLGAGYAAAVVALPRPTMVNAHVFGFTAVPLAAVVGCTALRRPAPRAFRALVTGVATLTVATVAYLLVYWLV